MPEKDVLLIIDFDKDGCAFVRTADKNGKQCIPDSNSFTGPLKTLLRSIEQIYKASQFSITWGENNEEGVSLADNRHLIYQLIECPNLCDCEFNPLIYDREKLWSLTLRLPGPDSPSHEFVLQNGDEVYGPSCTTAFSTAGELSRSISAKASQETGWCWIS